MPSSRTIVNKTVLLWALVLIATLSCGVQAAPRRQGDPPIVIPSSDTDFEKFEISDDPKQREEILLALIQMYKNEMQKQGIEDDQNVFDSGAIAPLEALPNLPFPVAIQSELLRSPDGVNKDKRGSYQPTLCYFKICNMGRKRNIR